jgi:hypothetical protein
MSEKYDYEIDTEKLNPPLGGTLHYAAKVSFLVRLKENHTSERVSHNLGERWGATREEAFDKMKQAVEEWIADHQ